MISRDNPAPAEEELSPRHNQIFRRHIPIRQNRAGCLQGGLRRVFTSYSLIVSVKYSVSRNFLIWMDYDLLQISSLAGTFCSVTLDLTCDNTICIIDNIQ